MFPLHSDCEDWNCLPLGDRCQSCQSWAAWSFLRDCEFIGQSQPPMTPRHAMDVDRCEKYINRRKISPDLFLQRKSLKETTKLNNIEFASVVLETLAL